MRSIIIIAIVLTICSFSSIQQVYKNDPKIFGRWKVTSVETEETTKGSLQTFLNKANIPEKEYHTGINNYYGKLELKFEQNSDLIIFNSPESSKPIKGMYRMQKPINGIEFKLEITGSQALGGKYTISFNKNGARLVFPDLNKKISLVFNLVKVK